MWFKYAGGNNYVTANTCSDDTDFDTIIYVFSSCSTAGAASTCVTYNEDYCDSQSSVTWAALSGTMYYIFVTGFGTTTGHFMLEVTESSVCLIFPLLKTQAHLLPMISAPVPLKFPLFPTLLRELLMP